MKKIKTSILLMSAFCALSLGVSQTLNIQQSAGVQNYQIAQIAQIIPRVDSTIYNLVGGGRYATLTLGQKWTFGGITSASKVNSVPVQIQFALQENRLRVIADVSSQFKLSLLNGQVVAQSKNSVLEWNAAVQPAQIYILQVQSQSSNQSYLIRNSQEGK